MTNLMIQLNLEILSLYNFFFMINNYQYNKLIIILNKENIIAS